MAVAAGSEDRGALASLAPELRTLFFCLGAQKAGTTWLFKMLGRTPDCHVARDKELHYWTMMAAPRSEAEQIASSRRKLLRAVGDLGRNTLRGRRIRPAVHTILRRYRRFDLARDRSERNYAAKLLAGWRGQGVAGEMTPNYAVLGPDWFARMAALHPDTRMFLVMRDPVDRLWSGIRHSRTAQAVRTAEDDAALLEKLEHAIADPGNLDRRMSDYAATIEAMERVLPADKCAYFFFETMRSRSELDRLQRFLGTGQIPLMSQQRVNVGVWDDLRPSEDQMDRARSALDPVYRYVSARFGRAVPDKWRIGAPEGV